MLSNKEKVLAHYKRHNYKRVGVNVPSECKELVLLLGGLLRSNKEAIMPKLIELVNTPIEDR